ncbi:MAG: hypothetical protein ACXWJX_16230 [Limisphaerales bacterium]
MIIPPFNHAGEGGAEFCCLAFAPVMYRQTKAPRFPATLGIYFCAHKDFTRFSRLSFAADGHSLSYTRGNERHDTLEFLLLSALLESSVHPAVWRLFPRTQIPSSFNSDEYEDARRNVCRLLFHFRSLEMAARLTADLPHGPLMICDESAGRVAFGDSKDEDEEIERAIMQVG